jgi:hypothetical protein
MSVGIPSSNPAYSLDSILQSQVQGLTQPSPAPSGTAAPPAAAPGLATYNNLGSPGGDGASAGQLPAAPPPAQDTSQPPNGADLATSTTASVLTPGGNVSVRPVAGSAAQITFTNSATGEKSIIGTVSAGLNSNLNGTNVTVGNLTTNDVGVYASAQDAPTTAGTFNPAYSVKSGATQGSTTSNGVTDDEQQQQVSYAALVRANTDAGHLSSFISQYS